MWVLKASHQKGTTEKGENPMRIPQITEPCSGSRLLTISICRNTASKAVVYDVDGGVAV
ncbi:hypothetical protein Hanom_Chr11g00969931 [Helianthus anomalus]